MQHCCSPTLGQTTLHLPSPRHHPTCPFPSCSIPLALSPLPQMHPLRQLIPFPRFQSKEFPLCTSARFSFFFFPHDSGCDPGHIHSFFSVFFSIFFHFCQLSEVGDSSVLRRRIDIATLVAAPACQVQSMTSSNKAKRMQRWSLCRRTRAHARRNCC